MEKESIKRAFGVALGTELDTLGFTGGPGRGTALGRLLGLTRSQAKRVLTGASSPSINKLLPLRKLGVSFDRILDKVNGTKPITKTIYLNGKPVPAAVEVGPSGNFCGAALIPHGAGYELIALKQDAKTPMNAMPTRTLRFGTDETIAVSKNDGKAPPIVDMNESHASDVDPLFHVNNLFHQLTGNETYQAIVMDWKLTDMKEVELGVPTLQHIGTPVLILTSDLMISRFIARALNRCDVQFVPTSTRTRHLAKLVSATISMEEEIAGNSK